MGLGRAMTKHEASHLKKGLTLARREDLWPVIRAAGSKQKLGRESCWKVIEVEGLR